MRGEEEPEEAKSGGGWGKEAEGALTAEEAWRPEEGPGEIKEKITPECWGMKLSHVLQLRMGKLVPEENPES